jgi:hypothetical protein
MTEQDQQSSHRHFFARISGNTTCRKTALAEKCNGLDLGVDLLARFKLQGPHGP